MKLDWQVDCPVSPGLISLMQLAADRAGQTENLSRPCLASVRLCDGDTIRRINAAHRHLDQETDVLSFPTVRWPTGHTAGQAPAALRGAYDPEEGTCFLGDIVISVPRVKEQAAAYGHSESREAAYLLVHALCHLMGYDHMEEEEKKQMRTQEERILSSIGMGQESSHAVSDNTLLELAREAMTRSYSPYSHYPVGAALHCTDGRIFQGCNVENSSLGLTNCAERTALFKAVSEGAREFDVIAIASRDTAPWPCGACRQALSEFAPNIRVLISWGDGQTRESTLGKLLPEQFEMPGQE